MRPEFGCRVHDHVFEVLDASAFGAIENAVREAIERWEPRVTVTAVDFDLERRDEGCLDIVLTYEIPEVPGVRNLVHPFYVIPEEESEILDAEVVSW
jgi:phage baseplate assembly protein W